MARRLQANSGTDAPGGSYPYGRARDNTGSGNGTPVNEQFIGDITQFFERLMALTSTVANGQPENTANGFQFITALAAYIVSLAVAKSGSSMTGNLAMGNNKVTGLAAASGNGEAVRYEQLTTEQSTRSSADTTLQNNINALLPGAWQNIVLNASGGASYGPGARVPQYRIDGFGNIHLRGIIVTGGSPPSGDHAISGAAALPIPTQLQDLMGREVPTTDLVSGFYIDTNGTMRGNNTAGPWKGQVVLDGISFWKQ